MILSIMTFSRMTLGRRTLGSITLSRTVTLLNVVAPKIGNLVYWILDLQKFSQTHDVPFSQMTLCLTAL
jgi:hypothetical protein